MCVPDKSNDSAFTPSLQASYTLNREHTYAIGDWLETKGRWLTGPAGQFLSCFICSKRKLEPGKYGQEETLIKEVLSRIGKIVGLASWTLICSPFELLGVGMRCTATTFFRKSAVWIKPEEQKANTISALAKNSLPSSASSLKVGICSFNIAGMPNFLADRNGVERMDTRAEKIAKQLKEMPDDIICIQEGFEGFGKIAAMLKEKDPGINIVYDVGRNTSLRLGSGLVLISKHPIKNFQFYQHPHAGGSEKHASKGVLIATIELPNGQPVIIVNTHLSGGADDSVEFPHGGKSYRSDQLNHVKKRTKEYLENFKTCHPGVKPVVLFGGDFNIGPTRPTDPDDTHKVENGPQVANCPIVGDVPGVDNEWIYDMGQEKEGKPSILTELMSKEDYNHTTAKYLRVTKDELLKKNLLDIARNGIQARTEAELKRMDESNHVKMGPHFSSWNTSPMQEHGMGYDPIDTWTLKAEFIDHIYQANKDTFPGIGEAKRVDEHLSLENGVSDHTVNHVVFEIPLEIQK